MVRYVGADTVGLLVCVREAAHAKVHLTTFVCSSCAYSTSKKNEINTLVAKYMARVVAECAAFTQQVAGVVVVVHVCGVQL